MREKKKMTPAQYKQASRRREGKMNFFIFIIHPNNYANIPKKRQLAKKYDIYDNQ